MFGCPDFDALTNYDFKRISEGGAIGHLSLPAPSRKRRAPPSIEDGSDGSEEGDPDPAPSSPAGAASDIPMVMVMDKSQVLRSKVTGQSVTVHYDGFSHASGMRRAFVSCCKRAEHGGRCEKWVRCSTFASEEAMHAWLFAWAVVGARSTSSRVSHMYWAPGTAELYEAARQL